MYCLIFDRYCIGTTYGRMHIPTFLYRAGYFIVLSFITGDIIVYSKVPSFRPISPLNVAIFQFLHIFFLSYTFFNLSNGYYLSLSYFSFYIISLSPILFLYYVFLYLWNWKFHKDVITPESFFPVVNDLFHC